MMKPEIKICVSITDEVLMKIKSRIENEKHEELIRPVLYEVAKMLEISRLYNELCKRSKRKIHRR